MDATFILEGKQAAAQGKALSDNPYFTGEFTKLGTPKLSDEGHLWNEGFQSVGRRASAKEVADAQAYELRNFVGSVKARKSR